MSFGAARLADRAAVQLIIVVFTVLHLATGVLELVYLSYTTASLVLATNIGVRIIAAALFLVAWRVWRR